MSDRAKRGETAKRVPSDRRSRKGKSCLEEGKPPEIVLSVSGYEISILGDAFSFLFGDCSNHKSFMDDPLPFNRVLQAAQASFILKFCCKQNFQ